MQREAGVIWAELADSWNLRTVRAFKTRFPEAGQAAAADRRIAFLIQHHREAQAELNRLGYDAGPVDGIWGLRSTGAMRAFQGDSGLARDGVLSRASLDRLKTASQRIEAPVILTSAPQPQPSRPAPEAAAASPSTDDGIPEGSRWIAFGESGGSKIAASAIRSGEILKVVFNFDYNHSGAGRFASPSTQSCAIVVADLVFECWIRSRDSSRRAKVAGTFPRLTFQAMGDGRPRLLPGDIVLDFSPEPRNATPMLSTPTIPAPEPQPRRAEPEVAEAFPSTDDGIAEGSRWIAFGEAEGSTIVATVTRHGDTLNLVFDVDHRRGNVVGTRLAHRSMHSCTVSVADPVLECWIPGLSRFALGARVIGTFPQVTWQVRGDGLPHALPGDIVLDFHPEQKLAQE